MSENEIDTQVVQNALMDLLEVFSPGLNGHGRVAAYKDLAHRISNITQKHSWSWRYVKSVMSGTVKPGKLFARATMVLVAQLDNPSIMDVEPVTVYAAPGIIHENALVLTPSRPCARPGCPIHFVPVVHNQRYHSYECKQKHRKEVKVQIT